MLNSFSKHVLDYNKPIVGSDYRIYGGYFSLVMPSLNSRQTGRDDCNRHEIVVHCKHNFTKRL